MKCISYVFFYLSIFGLLMRVSSLSWRFLDFDGDELREGNEVSNCRIPSVAFQKYLRIPIFKKKMESESKLEFWKKYWNGNWNHFVQFKKFEIKKKINAISDPIRSFQLAPVCTALSQNLFFLGFHDISSNTSLTAFFIRMLI